MEELVDFKYVWMDEGRICGWIGGWMSGWMVGLLVGG
jgi:hypothetical protein